MNVSFISLYEVTPPFSPAEELISLRHGNGARNEHALLAKYDEEEKLLVYAPCESGVCINAISGP